MFNLIYFLKKFLILFYFLFLFFNFLNLIFYFYFLFYFLFYFNRSILFYFIFIYFLNLALGKRISSIVNGSEPSATYDGSAKFEMLLDEGEYVNFEVSLYKGKQENLEVKETDQKSELEKIQRLFSKYFGTYGGKGFVIIHKGKRFNFDSTRVKFFFIFYINIYFIFNILLFFLFFYIF